MQTIYIGNSRKIGDIDLRKNRVYTDRPAELIKNLEDAGFQLASQLFVPVDELNAAQTELQKPGTPIFLANKQVLK